MSEQKPHDIAKQRVEATLGTVDTFLSGTKQKDHAKLKEKYHQKLADEYKKVLKEQETERKLTEKRKKEERKIQQQKQKEQTEELALEYPDPKRNKKIKTFCRVVRKGYSELIPCKEINAEQIELKLDGKKRKIYTGVQPKIEKLPPSTTPGVAGKLKPPVYIRTHFLRWGEPFTRDEFTGDGKILIEEKMISVLVEKEFFTEEKQEDGSVKYVPNPDKVDTEIYNEEGYTIYDVSHIDFVTAEVAAIETSKLLENWWISAKKIGAMKDTWIPLLIMGAVAVIGMWIASG